jgi:hypothetical protein
VGHSSSYNNEDLSVEDQCTCYVASGPDPGYFSNYRFFGFRNLTAQSPDPHNLSSIFTTPAFYNSFAPQDCSVPSSVDTPVQLNNSISNIYVSHSNLSKFPPTTLNLRTLRLPTYQSAAELELTQKNLLHANIRIRARIDPDSAAGAVAGLFTYAEIYPASNSDTSDLTNPESDIEILTSDPKNTIRYSNQPDTRTVTVQDGNTTKNDTESVPGASTAVKPPNGKTWDAYLTHRLDWYPGISRFWIDNYLLLDKTYGVPRDPVGLILNMWSDSGEWSGNMSIGDSATLSVEYIEMAFNTSGLVSGPIGAREKRGFMGEVWRRFYAYVRGYGGHNRGCKVVCKIDGRLGS